MQRFIARCISPHYSKLSDSYMHSKQKNETPKRKKKQPHDSLMSWAVDNVLLPPLSGDYAGKPLVLNIDCTICVRHWPNSSRIICSAWDKVHPSFSDSSAWARRQPHVASTTSSVMHASGHLSTHRSMVTVINKTRLQPVRKLKN